MTRWKSIPGYEDIYEASEDGRIRTAEGKTTYTEIRGTRHWKQRELRQKYYNSGYMVTLYKNGTPKKCLVARLIATTFIEDLLDSDMTVNHKDGSRRNNHVENLEWTTRADNIRHGFNTGLYKTIQNKIVLDDYVTSRQFESMAAASRYLGKSVGYVSNAIKKNHHIKGNDGTVYKVYF